MKGVGREGERRGKKGKEEEKPSEWGSGDKKRVKFHKGGFDGRGWNGKNAQSEKILEKPLTNPFTCCIIIHVK